MIRLIFFLSLSPLFAKDCRDIIARVEKAYGIPEGLLSAIAETESRCRPYAVSRGRQSFYFSTLQETTKFVEDAYRRGFKNLNVGCMQLNYRSHRRSFSNTPEMIHPELNIVHAAKLLKSAYQRYGSWENAVRTYNCGNPYGSKRYWNRIVRIWKS